MSASANNVRSVKGRRGVAAPAVEAEIDLRLAALCVVAEGRELTIPEIARATGLSHGGVHYLQESALRKIRRALGRERIRTWEGVAV